MVNCITFDSLWYGFHLSTMEGGQYNNIKNAAIGVKNQRINWIGKHDDLPHYNALEEHNLEGGWVTPGLIDCHTHLVFGGERSKEFEQRLNGVSYQKIYENGGGIASSVKATRNETCQQLTISATRRLISLMKDGVTTLEIKSGYGLSLEHEVKMLQVARSLAKDHPIDIKTTCLAAHALPPEFKDRADDYIDYLCTELLPEIAKLGLADAVDAFCEGIGFSTEQVERYFKVAKSLGLPVKLHAEQLSSLGGASLASRYQALSVDHLEYITKADVISMDENGTVAVLLPGAFYTLKETQKPPIELLRQFNIPMAIATDSNPGTSPSLSLRLMMNMACTLFNLTPEEALAGTTIHAAKALGIEASHGEISLGKIADFICWDVESPAELSYWLGGDLLKTRIKSGVRYYA